jgi:hypothetical protein
METSMSRIFKSAALAAACLGLVVAAPAGAGKSSGGTGGNTATIAFASTGFAAAAAGPSSGSSVSFKVTARVKPSAVYSLWVANVCSQDGVTVSAEYHAVQNWVAGPFTVSKSGTQCTAFVWMFPDAWTSLKGGSMTYSVSG